MRRIIQIGILALLFSACRNNGKEPRGQALNDTLSYHYDSVKSVSPMVVKTEGLMFDTTKAIITYPVFSDTSLNTFLKRQVFNYFAKEEPEDTYGSITKSFISGYEEFRKDYPERLQSWYLIINLKVLRQLPGYLSVQYSHADYAGGAHGNSSINYLNYNPETKQEIALDSLIVPGKMPQLVKIAENIFRKNEKLNSGESLEDRYFFENGKFSLAQNFRVTDQGLLFLYNPYEIKPYVDGYTELLIPFRDIQDIARPHSILSSSH